MKIKKILQKLFEFFMPALAFRYNIPKEIWFNDGKRWIKYVRAKR